MPPIIDNHIHIDLHGRGITAIKEFKRVGGTHVVLVSKPSFKKIITKPEDYREVFSETLKIAKEIKQIDVVVYPVLGVHPTDISKLMQYYPIDKSKEIMIKVLKIAREFVLEGEAYGIKTGLPHYPVKEEVLMASKEIMEYGMKISKEIDCAVQLHTSSDEKDLVEISTIAKKLSLNSNKVIKHFAPPLVNTCNKLGIFPSVIASKDWIIKAIREGTRFMMETDYIDDPNRPGAVLGPKTVPRRTKKLIETFGEDIFWIIHKENPEKVYNIEIEF